MHEIAAMPTATLEGVDVKLRAIAEWSRDDDDDLISDGIRTALEAVERLAAE